VESVHESQTYRYIRQREQLLRTTRDQRRNLSPIPTEISGGSFNTDAELVTTVLSALHSTFFQRDVAENHMYTGPIIRANARLSGLLFSIHGLSTDHDFVLSILGKTMRTMGHVVAGHIINMVGGFKVDLIAAMEFARAQAVEAGN